MRLIKLCNETRARAIKVNQLENRVPCSNICIAFLDQPSPSPSMGNCCEVWFITFVKIWQTCRINFHIVSSSAKMPPKASPPAPFVSSPFFFQALFLSHPLSNSQFPIILAVGVTSFCSLYRLHVLSPLGNKAFFIVSPQRQVPHTEWVHKKYTT